MARPQRNNVDYFPFLCEDGEKMFYLEQTYGNDGFAVFVKLLRELAKKDFHYLNLSDKSAKMFLASKCRVSIELLNAIIEDLVNLGKFDKMLWDENSIIWCQDFIDSVQDAYEKRINKCINYDGLLLLLEGLGVRKQSKLPLKGSGNPQRIVKDRKGKDRIENNNKEFIPPTLSEFKEYCISKGYSKIAEKAFEYYSCANWKDSQGNQVKNWKQKLNGVWFKDENKDLTTFEQSRPNSGRLPNGFVP